MMYRARNYVLLAMAVLGLAVTFDTEPAAQAPGSIRGRVSIGIPVTELVVPAYKVRGVSGKLIGRVKRRPEHIGLAV